jgi:hypothetical protein
MRAVVLNKVCQLLSTSQTRYRAHARTHRYIHTHTHIYIYRLIKTSLCDKKLSVFEQSPHNWWIEEESQNILGMWTVLYWTQSSIKQFCVSINVWRRRGTLWTLLVTFCIVIIRCIRYFWSSGMYVYIYIYIMGCDSSVCIATRYELDGFGIEPRWEARFSAPVQTGSRFHRASCTMGIEYSRRKSSKGVPLTTNPHLAPRLSEG